MNVVWMNWRCPAHPWAGGAEEHLQQIGKRLVDAGHAVRVLTARGPDRELQPRDTIDGMEVYRRGSTYSVYPLVASEYLRRHRRWADVVVDDVNGIPFFTPLYVRRPTVAVVHHLVRDIFYDELPLPLAALGDGVERSLPTIYRSQPVVTVSHTSERELVEFGFDAEQLHVVHNGVAPVEPPTSLEREQADESMVLYLGRVKGYKRLPHLLSAWETVQERAPDAVLHVAGDGPERPDLERRARERGMDEDVVFHGWVSEDERDRLYATADVFVTPTEKEGFGLTVLEANSAGTPTVAYDVPGINEVVEDGVNGVLVQEETPTALGRAVGETLQNGEGLVEGARERASEFSWDRAADQFEGILQTAVS